MNQGQFPDDRSGRSGPSGLGRRRPSPEMRERAEQMAELLDRAAPAAARSRRGRRLAGVSSALLGLGAFTIGGVGVVLGLDPQSAGQELSLPSLDGVPGTTGAPSAEAVGHRAGPGDTDSSGAGPSDAGRLPDVDATTGIAPLVRGAQPVAQQQAAQPASAPGPGPADLGGQAPATTTPTSVPTSRTTPRSPVHTSTPRTTATRTSPTHTSTPRTSPTAPRASTRAAAPTSTPRHSSDTGTNPTSRRSVTTGDRSRQTGAGSTPGHRSTALDGGSSRPFVTRPSG